MEKDMQELEATAFLMREKESATKKEAAIFQKEAKDKAQKMLQKLTEDYLKTEQLNEQRLVEELALEEQMMADNLAKELSFYFKQYEEKRETARKNLIKEMFGYVYREDERISTDTA